MKKRLLISGLFLFMMSTTNNVFASEETKEVTAEKLWSVEFSVPILNEETNLNKIKVVNDEGEEISTVKKVSDKNTKIVEIVPTEPYVVGEYSIHVPMGLKGRYDLTLNEEFEKDFIVTKSLSTTDLTGKWTSLYVHEKALLGIDAQFLSNGMSNVQISRLGMGFKGEAQYEIKNGVMKMQSNIENMNVMSVEGKMYIYNEKLFKIVSNSGNEAYFTKK